MEKGKKYIHYCWFGGKKLPRLARKCIKSWRKYLPDYEIVCWNEQNVDVNECPFVKEAYKQKKWAFVADYARVKALYEYGGVYFDTDMMLKKEIDFLLEKPAFIGIEDSGFVAAGVWGSREPKNFLVKEVLDFYKKQKHFNSQDLYSITIPVIITEILRRYGFDGYNNDVQNLNGVYVYPRDYFYPLSYDGQDNIFTDNTCMIHYSDASWVSKKEKRDIRIIRRYGRKKAAIILGLFEKTKACIRFYIEVIRRTASLVVFPIKFIFKIKKIESEDKFRNTIDEIKKCKGKDIVFIHGAWMGVKSATTEMFNNVVALPEIDIVDDLDEVVDAVLDNDNIKMVFFGAFAWGWEYFAKKIKRRNPKIIIKVIWHGSNAMHMEWFDWDRFQCVFKLLNDGTLKSIVFVKKSMYEQYKKLGYKVEFLPNTIHKKYEVRTKKIKKNKDDIRIGIYASGDRWVKNFYNQMAAASLVDNAILDMVPLSDVAKKYANIIKIRAEGEPRTISRKELFKRIINDDVVLYATFVECAPMLPLECLELGVPCITGDNHHYWVGTPLEKYLVEPKVDNPVALAKRIKNCVENKDEILKLYREWKKKYDLECDKILKDIIED